MNNDFCQKFIFEDANVRGELVRLNNSYQEVISKASYPPPVKKLLGELMCASVLLSATLKFDGSLTIHARSNGAIPLVMAECRSHQLVRATAHMNEKSLQSPELINNHDLQALLQDGKLAVHIQPKDGQQYQGVIPLEHNSLSACLEDYFSRSEQLPTKLIFSSEGDYTSGLLIQSLPTPADEEPMRQQSRWDHLTQLIQNAHPSEVLALPTERLLTRTFPSESLRIFDKKEISFDCTCTRERTLSALSAMDRSELRSLLEKKSVIVVDCQFCSTRYKFANTDISHLVSEPAHSSPNGTH